MLADNAYLGKHVAISGATGGIGRELAARFAALGAQLVLIDRDEKALNALAQAFPGSVALV
ncbi:MAG: short chain dehydrogenase, partial [Devosia sp.]|nr:short chain dehydrogenase [Devosia sp.]